MTEQKRYRAFISYSQQDHVWGKRLHTWLETYRVPVGVVADVQQTRRLGRFFRDEEEMSAASDIAVIVRRAIDVAESLIVICSPRSAQSQWVNAEIQQFRRTGGERKVFAFIIDGVPNSGDPATECFPPALRAVGDRDHPDALPVEPLGLDVRRDGKARACARLAAGLLDVDFDDLWRRDRRRLSHLYTVVGLTTVIGAALIGTALKTGFDAQAASMRSQLSAALPEQADLQMNAGQFDLAERYSLAALRLTPDKPELAVASLRAAMQQADGGLMNFDDRVEPETGYMASRDQSHILRRNRAGKAEILTAETGIAVALQLPYRNILSGAFSPDGGRLMILEKGSVSIWDTTTGKHISTLDTPGDVIFETAFSDDGSVAFTTGLASMSIWDADTGDLFESLDTPTERNAQAVSPDSSLMLSVEHEFAEVRAPPDGKVVATLSVRGGDVEASAFSSDGARIVTIGADRHVKIWNARDGRLVASLGGLRGDPFLAAFSADDKRLATGNLKGGVQVWETTGWKEVAHMEAKGGPVAGLAFSPDGAHLVAAGTDGIANIWHIASAKLAGSIGQRRGSMTGASFAQDGASVLLKTGQDIELWSVHRLVQPADALQHDACVDFLGTAGRRFSPEELAADSRLRSVWPDAERDVCEGLPGLPPLPQRQAVDAGTRGPAAFADGLLLCPRMTVPNAPKTNAAGRVLAYARMVDVQGVALALNPVRGGCLSAGFGKRGGVLHKGIDYLGPGGASVLAAGAGTVVEQNYRDDYGNMLLIDHGKGVFTRYSHLAIFSEAVRVGATVEAGQEIGLTGASAGYVVKEHLHYEILVGDYATPKKSFGLTAKSPFDFPPAR